MPYCSPSPTYVLCGSPYPLAQMLTMLSHQVIPWPCLLFMIPSPLTSKRAKSINEYTLEVFGFEATNHFDLDYYICIVLILANKI